VILKHGFGNEAQEWFFAAEYIANQGNHSAGDHRIVGQNLIASLGYLVDGTMTETLHDESFRDRQLCDAAQALDMDKYAQLVEAVLRFEQHIEPSVRAVSGE
jgi:3-deoxy-7-phosphoheptulonate synthase